MGVFDSKVIADLEPKTSVKTVSLGTIIDLNNEDLFECLIAQYAERYACNDDYTIDLPVYIVTQGKRYVGYVGGEHSQQLLKTQLQELVKNAADSEGECSLN
jgi:hypothetical protein